MNESAVKLVPRALWTHDLRQSERRFIAVMNELWFGRFECLLIQRGELVLDPWPTTVRYVKLGSAGAVSRKGFNDEFELECPVVELFEYVRAIDQGEILVLEVRHSRPFSMEVKHQPIMNSQCAARV